MVTQEINTKFFRNGKYAVSVSTGNEFAGHAEGTLLVVFVSAGRTEAALTSKRRKFKFTTMRASKHGTAIGGIPAIHHLLDVFHNGGTRMERVLNFFIIVVKDSLKYVHTSIMRENEK